MPVINNNHYTKRAITLLKKMLKLSFTSLECFGPRYPGFFKQVT